MNPIERAPGQRAIVRLVGETDAEAKTIESDE